MFKKILIANRGENGCKAVSAKPKRMACEACTGDFHAETTHV